MSNMLPALTALATGLASVVAIAGYHMLPVPSAAFTNSAPAAAMDAESSSAPARPFAQFAEMVKRWWRQQRTIEATFGLDDHLLRDIGLTPGDERIIATNPWLRRW